MKQRFLSLSVLFGLLLCFIAVQSPVGAQPAGQGAATQAAITGKVNTADLVLRAEPKTDAAKLAVLKAGDVLTVTGQTANGNWLFVTTADGKTGWVGSPYVVLSGGKLSDLPIVQAIATAEAAGCGTATAAIKGRVNTESLIMRREPNTNAEKVAILKAGDALTIIGQNKSTNWLLVTTADNLTGWVGSPYVFLTKGKLADIPVVDEAAVATQAATANATQAATQCPTATVSSTAVATTSASAAVIKGKVNADNLVVRNLPNTTAEKLKVLKAGDSVTVLGQTKNGNWLQIQTDDGIIGWVGSPYVVLSGGKLSDLPVTE